MDNRRLPQQEDDLAWKLVEAYQGLLTAAQRTAAFVDLGAGSFQVVIRTILKAVAAQKVTLSEQAATDIQGWIDCYNIEAEFGEVLSRAVGAAALNQSDPPAATS